MSGGHFHYYQDRITEIADSIQELIDKNGVIPPQTEMQKMRDEEPFYRDYPPEIIEEFKKAVRCLHEAFIRAKRIDYWVCNDDGEDTFVESLKEQLSELPPVMPIFKLRVFNEDGSFDGEYDVNKIFLGDNSEIKGALIMYCGEETWFFNTPDGYKNKYGNLTAKLYQF